MGNTKELSPEQESRREVRSMLWFWLKVWGAVVVIMLPIFALSFYLGVIS